MTAQTSPTMIEQLTEALSTSRARLQEMEADYSRLRAQVVAYENCLSNIQAVVSGDFSSLLEAPTTKAKPQYKGRKGTHKLREDVFEFFESRPHRIESPKTLSKWLISDKGWPADGLGIKVSNLLRKIVKEEGWLNKVGHGKYQFSSTD
jgi:hypothetical protein